ncbi:MAG: glycosyltransferase family 2 protein, partial [Myxococcaceae bacterium]
MCEGVPRVSVVVATFERRRLLVRLLNQLAQQTLAPELFEVVVVDDGSTEPVAPSLSKLQPPYPLTLERQPNAGAAAARHRGVLLARGEIIVIVDDDMQVDPDFLERHLEAHGKGRVAVLGRIRADPDIRQMPLFERWYAQRLDGGAEAVRRG